MSQSALTFADGGSALLRDPRQVPVKLRRPFDHARMAFSTLAADAMDIVDEAQQQRVFALAAAAHPELSDAANDALILALVAEWSYGEVSQAVLENLPAGTFDALLDACEKLAPQLNPRFEVNPDPKATGAE